MEEETVATVETAAPNSPPVESEVAAGPAISPPDSAPLVPAAEAQPEAAAFVVDTTLLTGDEIELLKSTHPGEISFVRELEGPISGHPEGDILTTFPPARPNPALETIIADASMVAHEIAGIPSAPTQLISPQPPAPARLPSVNYQLIPRDRAIVRVWRFNNPKDVRWVLADARVFSPTLVYDSVEYDALDYPSDPIMTGYELSQFA